MNQLPFGFVPGSDGEGFDMSKLGEMLQQVGAMMQRAQSSTETGPVSWSTIHDVARDVIAKAGDPAITDSERKAVADAVELAQTWLDAATEFPASSTRSFAWSSSEWLETTLQGWKPLVDPVAGGLAQTIATISSEALPESQSNPEMAQMIGPMVEMAKRMSAVTTGMQVGQGFAVLSSEMLSAGDTGLALSPDFTPALLPGHIKQFAAENELPIAEVMVYVAVREAALERLYNAQPWLRNEVADAIARYARGIRIDTEQVRDAISNVDPADPNSMNQLLQSGAFQPANTPEQLRTLGHIELLLAVIEGWVASVAVAAIDNRLAAVGPIEETMNRRRAAGGPAEKTFANLVGLELRPRLVRAAIRFWSELAGRVGADRRDQFWAHPDLLPSAEELEDLDAFLAARQ